LDIDRGDAIDDRRVMALLRSDRGHTLPELLVATAVVGLVLAGVVGLLRSGVQAYGRGSARVDAQQSARIALDRMARELREAGYDPRGTGIAAIVVADPARVTFDRDLNGNGVVDATSERVTFLLRAGESVLRRDAGAGAQPLAEHVRALAFTYYDPAGAQTADPRAVASIRIRVEVGRAAAEPAMTTEVALRNYVPVTIRRAS
jgi:type IV pilus assembly protein PilW